MDWDHPRVRGEKLFISPAIDLARGSPPRMQGKGQQHVLPGQLDGITPAHAGKRCTDLRLRPHTGDHPRACGEKEQNYRDVFNGMGSPPRVRGKGRPVQVHRPYRGITPARAGKRSRSCACRNADGDHPRACGAYVHPCLRSKIIPSPYAFPAPIPPETAWRKRSASLICRMPS